MNKDEQKLYEYLDGELSPKEARAFNERITQDPALKKSFEFSKNLSGQIRASLKQELLRQNPQAEEVDLWASIRDNILQHHEKRSKASSALFLNNLQEFFRFPRPVFSPAFVVTGFALVFAFYLGQKAEQYISHDVVGTDSPELASNNSQIVADSKIKSAEALNTSELSFIGNQVSSDRNRSNVSRSFRSRLLQAASLSPSNLAPSNLESAMPSCFIKLNSPHLGFSPKEPIELGREKQVTFQAVDGTSQHLRLKLLRFIPRKGLSDLLDMQVRWLDQSNESLVAENLRITNGSRVFLEAGKKPEEQTKLVLATKCE